MKEGLAALTKLVKVVMAYRPAPKIKEDGTTRKVSRTNKPKRPSKIAVRK